MPIFVSDNPDRYEPHKNLSANLAHILPYASHEVSASHQSQSPTVDLGL